MQVIWGGHTTIKLDGEPCNCGNIGCIETVASTWAIPGLVHSHPDFNNSALRNEPVIDFEAIFRLAAQGDQLSKYMKEKCIEAWSFGIINLVHSFDPEMVIIGGGVMESEAEILPIIQEMVDKHTWLPEGTVEVVAAQNKNHAALLGLSYLIQNIN